MVYLDNVKCVYTRNCIKFYPLSFILYRVVLMAHNKSSNRIVFSPKMNPETSCRHVVTAFLLSGTEMVRHVTSQVTLYCRKNLSYFSTYMHADTLFTDV